MRGRLASWALAALLPPALVVSGCAAPDPPPWPAEMTGHACATESTRHRYLTAVDPTGRHFVDQHDRPLLVRGDSPWSGLLDWSPEQAELWFADRERHGVNAAIMSLIGAEANGGPADDGATYDGIRPFVGGDITRWQEAYWTRVERYLDAACEHGITVLLYVADGWNFDKPAFARANPEQLRRYGQLVAQRFRTLPNVMWLTGGDYAPQPQDDGSPADSDQLFAAILDGIRSTGDRRPYSVQLFNHSFSTESSFWADRVNWNFVYAYHPTYQQVLAAYRSRGPAGRPLPALFAEGNYEGENNTGGAPTTDETLRRQLLWAITSGSPGDVAGSADWSFPADWEQRLDTPAVAQAQALRALVASLPWWRMPPDDRDPVVLEGRGTPLRDYANVDVLDNDYVTACGSRATGYLVYVPTARTIRLDRVLLAPGSRLSWVDPADAGGPRRPAALDADGRVSTPGANSGGGQDWLLLTTPPRRR